MALRWTTSSGDFTGTWRHTLDTRSPAPQARSTLFCTKDLSMLPGNGDGFVSPVSWIASYGVPVRRDTVLEDRNLPPDRNVVLWAFPRSQPHCCPHSQSVQSDSHGDMHDYVREHHKVIEVSLAAADGSVHFLLVTAGPGTCGFNELTRPICQIFAAVPIPPIPRFLVSDWRLWQRGGLRRTGVKKRTFPVSLSPTVLNLRIFPHRQGSRR